MKNLKMIFILLFSAMLSTSCDKPNNLTEYSKTDTDDALYLEAKKKIDKADWDGAITLMTSTISAPYRARTEVKESLMHAYGGKCGISFLSLIKGLKNMNSTNSMFEMSMRLFAGTSVNLTACDRAIETLLSIGPTASQRTNDQNMFAAILGITRMGVTLRTKLDTDFSGLGDGVVDGTADFCSDSTAALHLSDADMNRIATGVGLLFENIASLGDQLSGGTAGAAFEDAKAVCETPLALPTIGTAASYGLPGVWVDYGLPATPSYQDIGLPADIQEPLNCLATRDSEVSAKMRRLFRRLINSDDLGYGGCDLSDISINPSAGPALPFVVQMDCCPGITAP